MGDRSVDARGLLAQIDLHFLTFLLVFKKVFGEAKYLTDLLQSPSLDLGKAVDLLKTLIATVSERVFDEMWRHFIDIELLTLLASGILAVFMSPLTTVPYQIHPYLH